jgi:diguanylate cyclase (GGDEF)-like protein/PAS domain S-box-containing protein
MVARKLKTTGEPAETAASDLSRLRSANANLQAAIADHLTSGEGWQAERVLFRAMIDQVQDYLFVKDNKSRFVIANRAVAADLGMKQRDLIGKTDFDLHPTRLAKKFFADEQSVIASGEPMIDIEEFVITVSGAKKWLLTSKVPLRNERGEVIGIVGICRDITDRKRAEDQIHFMAHHDALTGLPNRSLLMDRLSQALLRAQRNDRRVTVIFVDLDNFKVVNDSLGHSAGDKLLKAVADRMVRSVRATDTVARLGGDEFVILLNDEADNSDAEVVIKKVRAVVSRPISIDEQLFHVTCSMGVAAYPDDGEDAEALVMNADAAMYRAKETGRDRVQAYAAEMKIAADEKRVLQEGLRMALERGEFALLYQPQVDLESGRVFAVEALARWNHPELGVIEPSKFIPIAEESGLIVRLGDWALREACRQNKAWQDAGLPPLTVCVNVSARQFREKRWVKRVRKTLKETGLDAKYLELELTESLLMHDVPQAIATMRELQEIGVRFAIDDFGTGYSSLSALKNFPVARLKLDGSFVRNLPHDANDRSIATAVISLGQRLNMRVIAEGVETEEQLAFLRENHCQEVQGYIFSPPVGPRAFEEWMRTGDLRPAR